ncbi:MAG: hypothetical protein EHM24_15540 [Acidobacteria bacterium]|nr:MAG: hypothetical protein EHM24_15540 [Acidobacteriota bacterium]
MRPVLSFLSLGLVASSLFVAGCGGADLDVSTALRLTDVTTGWFDAGIIMDAEGQKNKLVPTISFRIKNVHTEPIKSVQLFAKFMQVGDDQEWGSPPYIRVIGPDGLAPGGSTEPIVLRSDRGYTGQQPRAQMLQNSNFVDARVELYAKYRANNFVKLGEQTIQRQLLTK